MVTLADALPEVPVSQIVLRLALSLLLGAVIGIDRQLRGKPAGLRTMMLVCLGACTFVLLSLAFRTAGGETMTTADCSRIIQGVVGGIGFLGAGVVMHSGMRVHGITTAAAVWVAAAVGVAIGMGEIRLSVLAAGAAVLTLTVAGRAEEIFFRPPLEQGPDSEPPNAGKNLRL